MPEIRRRRRVRSAGEESPNTPAQQDEADIVEEVGAEPAEGDAEGLVADEATLLKEGAADAESIRENRRARDVVERKRRHEKNVGFNIDDVLIKYEETSKVWPVSTMEILVKRLTGAPIQWVIQSRPRTGPDLYAAIKALHGRNDQAEYHLTFRDSGNMQSRGSGRITLPDLRDELPPQPPQGQPMNPQYPYPPPPFPYGAPQYPQPPAYPQPQPQPMYPPQQQVAPAPQPAPVPPPPMPQAPPMPPPGTDVETARAWFELWQKMNPQAPAPQQQYQPPPPPQPQIPPPPPGAVVYVPGYGYMQAVGVASQPQPAPAPAPPQPAPPPMPVGPPPGTVFVYGLGFVPEALAQAMGVGLPGPTRPGPLYRGGPPPYGPRPPFAAASAHDMGVDHRPSFNGNGAPPPPPEPPRSAAQEFRDMLGVVRSAVDMSHQIQALTGGAAEQPQPEFQAPTDEAPVQIMDVGGAKLVLDKETGGVRMFETGWANMGSILKWAGEQREAIQKANHERPAPKQQLPPGYVEVTPDYRPPPGYVVGQPIDMQPHQMPQAAQAPLPQAPSQMFAQPLTELAPEEAQAEPHTWAMPAPGGE